ncbi:hypothetical protein PIB30_024586 [Stylosanthes scabra]|uniref:Uncharacterized protein n=1 Tax=Stylosanthes scabra TaxID=79078 RepID=A0ABU6UAU5_9FABA|nr:hypothetical protein [Stylosanthes scabra]
MDSFLNEFDPGSSKWKLGSNCTKEHSHTSPSPSSISREEYKLYLHHRQQQRLPHERLLPACRGHRSRQPYQICKRIATTQPDLRVQGPGRASFPDPCVVPFYKSTFTASFLTALTFLLFHLLVSPFSRQSPAYTSAAYRRLVSDLPHELCRPFLRRAGFEQVAYMGLFDHDYALVSALIER